MVFHGVLVMFLGCFAGSWGTFSGGVWMFREWNRLKKGEMDSCIPGWVTVFPFARSLKS